MISDKPYIFSRSFTNVNYKDEVVIGLDLGIGRKELPVDSVFEDGTKLKDAFSEQETEVQNGKAIIDSEYGLVLLEFA
jgi:alpha-amylase